MAWNRSGLAILGCGLIVMRGLTLQGIPPAQVTAGAVILGLGVLSCGLAAWHAHRRLGGRALESPPRPGDLGPVAVGVAVIGVAAFVLGLLFPA
jgi:uncharacterized membrane protein YidH (DUF202 family)